MFWSRKFQKYTIKHFQTGGRAPGAPALDPPLPLRGDNFQLAKNIFSLKKKIESDHCNENLHKAPLTDKLNPSTRGCDYNFCIL